MKATTVALATLAWAAVAAGAELADGLYAESGGPKAIRVKAVDERTVGLGERLDLKFTEVQVCSTDNANSEFRVDVDMRDVKRLGYILAIDGDIYAKWFAFDKQGTYSVLGSYYLEFCDPEGDSGFAIWEDYATAPFTVKVRKPG